VSLLIGQDRARRLSRSTRSGLDVYLPNNFLLVVACQMSGLRPRPDRVDLESLRARSCPIKRDMICPRSMRGTVWYMLRGQIMSLLIGQDRARRLSRSTRSGLDVYLPNND
jgi:hypothetical protein